jgi:hypothetical protein
MHVFDVGFVNLTVISGIQVDYIPNALLSKILSQSRPTLGPL